MSSPNAWKRFQKMIPTTNLIIVTVSADNADGTYRVTNEQGNSFNVRSSDSYSVGAVVFIQGGRIEGTAPTFSSTDYEV